MPISHHTICISIAKSLCKLKDIHPPRRRLQFFFLSLTSSIIQSSHQLIPRIRTLHCLPQPPPLLHFPTFSGRGCVKAWAGIKTAWRNINNLRRKLPTVSVSHFSRYFLWNPFQTLGSIIPWKQLVRSSVFYMAKANGCQDLLQGLSIFCSLFGNAAPTSESHGPLLQVFNVYSQWVFSSYKIALFYSS